MLDVINQKGAVMLLVAMLASTLILLAGLAIDSAVIANSKVQQRHAAEYMALGSLKAFNEDSSTAPTHKLISATSRAQQLAQENHFLAKNFLKNSSAEIIGNNDRINGTHGKITPGIWYFKEGSGACNSYDGDDLDSLPDYTAGTCPCAAGPDPTKWAAPCFRELDLSAASPPIPNAIRVELKTASSSPIQTLFARVKGQDTISISSSATAVQVPRRGVFLVDLSRHSHEETHIPYQIASHPTATSFSSPGPVTSPDYPHGEYGDARFAGEYSYKLQTPNACPASRRCLTTAACTFDEGNTGATLIDLYNTIYKYVGPWPLPPDRITENNRATTTRPTKHYKNDYLCFNIDSYVDNIPDADPTDSNPSTPVTYSSEPYLIDTYYGVPPPIYDGAEPLNTMLTGVNEAIKQFKKNIVPSDEITVIGFDGSASIDVRTLGPVAIDSGNTTFQELEKLSDVTLANPANFDNAAYLASRFQKHFFFPRVESAGLDKQKNIPEALKRAKEILVSAGNQTSENFVVLISDGITSCYENSTPQPLPQRCSTSGSTTICSACSTSYAGFRNSFNQAEKIINTDYIPNNIKFHFLQIGLRSSPHTLQIVKEKAGVKTCMSTEEMLSADHPAINSIDATFTDPTIVPPVPVGAVAEENSFIKITYGELNFPPASDFGRLAQKTKGKYLPIRFACPGVGITATLNAECNNPALNNGDIVPNGSLSDGHGRGRITCDSLGRDRRTQMKDAIAEVFNVDPYIIVD